MIRILFVLFALLSINIAQAGSYEDALKKNDKVFLYFYLPDCRTCNAFNPIYESLKSKNKEYGFVKINVETPYGYYTFSKFRGRYVPLIILTDSKTKKSVQVSHTCIIDNMCLMRAMKSFN